MATGTEPKRRPRGNEGKGRPKGSVNKTCISRDVKEMVLQALNAAGGVEYLTQQARENPKTFLPLIAKLLPTRVEGDSENPIRVIHCVTRRIIGGQREHDGNGEGKNE